MPFATYEDIAARLGRPLSAGEQAAATAVLAEAEAAVQTYTGQRFTPGEQTERIVSMTGSVILAQRPVKALTGLRIVGQVADVTSLLLDGNTVSYLPVGIPLDLTYTYGYDTIPEDIKGVVVRSALRAMTNPTGVTTFTVGGYSETRGTDANANGSILGVSDTQILDRYRLRTGTSFIGNFRVRRDPSHDFQGPDYYGRRP